MLDLRTWRLAHDGGVVTLVAPDGGAELRVGAEQAPRRGAQAVAEETAAELGLEGVIVEPTAELETDEGELAWIAPFAGTRGGVRIAGSAAAVVGDATSTHIVGLAHDPRRAEAVRETVRALARTTHLGLGALRRRDYRYQAPPGWACELRGTVTCFTRGGATIAVFRARPLGSVGAGDLSWHLHEASRFPDDVSVAERLPLRPRRGLMGAIELGSSAGRFVDTATMVDDRFVYHLLVQGDPADADVARAAFRDLLASVQPIPRPRPSAPAAEEALSAWCS